MRRVQLTFWVLVLLAVLGMAGVSSALAGPTNALSVVLAVISGSVALVAALLALRIVIVLARRP